MKNKVTKKICLEAIKIYIINVFIIKLIIFTFFINQILVGTLAVFLEFTVNL